MTFLALNLLALLALHIRFLLEDPAKINPKAIQNYKELKEEYGDDAYSYIKPGLIVAQILFALLLFWEIAVLVYLAVNQYFIYAAISILVLSIWSFFRMTSYISKKIKEYLENPGDKVPLSFWEILRGKIAGLIKVLFYAVVLAKIFGFDVSQYI